MKYFLKRLMGFSLGPIIGALISLIQIRILTQILVADQYGVSGLYRNLILNIPNFLYIGLDQAFSREFHQAVSKKHLFQQAIIIPIGMGIVLSFVMLIFNQTIANWLFSDANAGYIVIWSAILLISMIVERFVLISIRMQEKAKEYSGFTILLKSLIFAVSLAMIALGIRDFRVVVFGMIFGQLLGDSLLFLRYRELLAWKDFVFDYDLIKKLLAFGFPLMVAMSLNSVLNTIDSLMLRSFSTKKELGFYAAGIAIVNMIGILKTAFATFWVPTAYRWHDEGKSMKHYKFISDAVLFILTGIFFGILVFRPVIMMILGEDYGSVQYILGLLCFPHIMYTLSETTTLGIVFSRKTYFNTLVSLLALIPSFFINLWLTPKWGALGAATASSGAYIMFYLARTYFSSRTGFYFNQSKHLLSICIMFIAAFINTKDYAYRLSITFGLALICLIIQFSTIRDGYQIWRQPEKWDFN
ncbi:lipopolysaccharide biosynthesis protein [Facklamia sp. 7083-14-GEN3]|uniref:lipopolysaccharide biosynthesis protein n=1 Tax=Facklamia sp. 7083-14-GEN3 TaxID=2973478 RepID=UPI00215C0780|nr:oligosaccharide flippase family protein [Facklamia sp. 7083-14-GEN3]MCR8969488.1 oligosaccharide flippase family protein [Facklamia sp. 7083-14-GEN3]